MGYGWAMCFTLDHHLFTTDTVAIVGDWHTDIEWMLKTVERVHATGVKHILHVGDFGLGLYETPETEETAMSALSQSLKSKGMKIAVTLGNHDNWVRFGAMPLGENGTAEAWDGIYFIPRGYRFFVNGVSFLSLGGAASTNFADLTEGIDWWREEVVTMGDLYRLGDEKVSVMITHDAPEAVETLEAFFADNPGLGPEAQRYAEQSRQAISAAVAQVQPEFLFHGHYHLPYVDRITTEGGDCTVVGLDMNGRSRNVALFNPVTREVAWL